MSWMISLKRRIRNSLVVCIAGVFMIGFIVGCGNNSMTLHGNDMPGVKELEAAASGIKITYEELPGGAECLFT